MPHQKQNEEALFWCHLLYDLIFDDIESGAKTKYLQELADKEHVFPDGSKKRVSLSTLKRKLKLYRDQGLAGLYRKKRKDSGQIRAVPEEILQTAIKMKKDQPLRGNKKINRMLQENYGVEIKTSTLYRHLKKAGATKRKLGVEKKKVRKRWSRDHTHSLWVGDFSFGPLVLVNDELQKTYFSAFIDCYSRYAVQAHYYLQQDFDVLVDTLLRAWNIHGAPKQLYVDNARVYHANALKSACYEMNIKLLHRPVRDPATGGLIERFIFSVQTGFEAEVRATAPMSINELNEMFNAWLELDYHQAIHSEIKETPKARYDKGLQVIRQVDLQKILHFFMIKESRVVDKIYSDVRLDKKFYRVDPRLRGDKVHVLSNPYGPQDKVFIYSTDEKYLGEGILHHREHATECEPYRQEKTQYDYLQLLRKQHQKQLSQGIDYSKLQAPQKWPFFSLLQTLARYLGRKGGPSAFNTHECEQLWGLWQSSAFEESLVVQAWQSSFPKNFVQFVFQLQKLLQEKEL